MSNPWLLGVEIGGTKLQLGLGRKPGEIEALRRERIVPENGAEGILTQILEAFPELLAEAGVAPGAVRAAGVGFGGPVDAETGRIETSFQVEGWTDFLLADWVRTSLNIPAVSVHNDADVAGLAEARLGAGAGVSPLLYLTIGSGIGGALILDGRIYRGAGRGAAEIGHLLVPAEGPNGPEMRELETVASGWGIGRAARRRAVEIAEQGRSWSIVGDPRQITAVDVARAAAKGDETALDVLAQAHQAMAFALCQAIALLAPRRIILGGGVPLMGEELWFRPIRERVNSQAFQPFRGSFDVVPAALGEEVVVHGAIELARDALASS
ncbi:ROK family protein [Paludisphaera rhizosphaerae]|uniref:ROK family protein n=1 Tax=Paludisphaera rhizosphaerae TaxID=2711216 RepID=UPI0013EC4917|nr:ROK family protein [Paludisphaera rhizosphaerae]